MKWQSESQQRVKVTGQEVSIMDSQILSSAIEFLLDFYQEILDALSVAALWLKSLFSPNAVILLLLGILLGLLPLPFIQRIRVKHGFWRIKSRLGQKAKGRPRDLISSVTRTLYEALPRTPIEIRKKEIENILEILAMAVEISSRYPTTDWKTSWSEVDGTWLRGFFSKCRMVHVPELQESFAKAFVYEAMRPGRFDRLHIDILASISEGDWKLFTAICGFSCCISGRITPVVFNYQDELYKKAGLDEEALATLIAAGLVTQGGTGDTYTLVMPDEGLGVTYFEEEQFIVRPLPAPIMRRYLGRTLTQPHPLDKNLNVGVVDFTQAGRALGFLTSCSRVEGFTQYLRCQWEVYLQG